MWRQLRTLNVYGGQILTMPNVVGVGYGLKETAKRLTAEEAIVVLVSKKLPLSVLGVENSVPAEIRGVKTDVVEVGVLKTLDELPRKERIRPACPGSSLGHYRVSAGTFGAVVVDNRTGKPLILSNNHVVANISNGRDGRANYGDPVYQPGVYDGGSSIDIIGKLERFVPIYRLDDSNANWLARGLERMANGLLRFLDPSLTMRLIRSRDNTNVVDAAVVSLLERESLCSKIIGIGEVKGVVSPRAGMAVKKSGRTTGVTRGTVRAVNATLQVMLGDVGVGLFTNQIVTTPMGEPGDSGSLVLDMNNRAVGLLSAGSSQATVLNNIEDVMNLLDISFTL